MELSIIIVSWKVKDRLQANLRALFQSQTSFDWEVFVVDNNSEDGSLEMIKNNFPSVKLIANAANRGFAVANNQAIRLAAGKFILLLNPDMQVYSDTLEKTVTWAKAQPQATVVGCQLVREDGTIIPQVRRFPKISDQLLVTLKIPHIFPGVLNNYLIKDFDYQTAAPVDSLRGAFFLINCDNYRQLSGQALPLLDERYFIWFEEVDFCRQVVKLGGQVWYTPVAHCRDYVGQSFRQLPRNAAQKYFRDSMLKYFQKWGQKWEYYLLRSAWGAIRIFYK